MQTTAQVFNPLRVVIPAYNAERVVESTLHDVFAWLHDAGYRVGNEPPAQHSPRSHSTSPSLEQPRASVIVIDDGSRDATAAAVRRSPHPVALLRNEPNRGKGYSVRRGVLAELGLTELKSTATAASPPGVRGGRGTGDGRTDTPPPGWVLFMDVDNSTPIRHLDRFAPFAADAQVLIASRRTQGAKIVTRQFRIRQILGKTFPYVVRTIALPDLTDTQCGFKVFRADVAARVFPLQRIERFAFDVEVLMLAKRLGCRIEEIPADWENPPESTLRVARDAPVMLLDVLKASWRLRRSGRVVKALREGWTEPTPK